MAPLLIWAALPESLLLAGLMSDVILRGFPSRQRDLIVSGYFMQLRKIKSKTS